MPSIAFLDTAANAIKGILGAVKNTIAGLPFPVDLSLIAIALILALFIKSTKMVKSLTPLFIIFNTTLIYLILKLA